MQLLNTHAVLLRVNAAIAARTVQIADTMLMPCLYVGHELVSHVDHDRCMVSPRVLGMRVHGPAARYMGHCYWPSCLRACSRL